MLQQITQTLQLRCQPNVCVSHDIDMPMTVGLFRPVIVLPENLYHTFKQDECLSVLAHESGHVKHRDNLIGLLQRIFIAWNWFNPLAYVISAGYSLTREDICDDYAVQVIDNPTRYTTCLVDLAEKHRLIQCFSPAIGLVGGKRSLNKRITRLLCKESNMDEKLSIKQKWLLVGVCALMMLCCVSIQTVFAEEQPSDLERVTARIRAAVASGNITPQQGRARLAAYQERLATAQQDSQVDAQNAQQKRMAQVLLNQGVAQDQVRTVLRAVRVIAHEITQKGDAFELDPVKAERLRGLGLTQDQIDTVMALAKRLANQNQRKQAQANVQQQNSETALANARRRIRGAIENGTITPEQGRARLRSIRERLSQAD